jgi:hypothetical protein
MSGEIKNEWESTPALLYITTKIAQYPGLFRCADHVIMKHVFCDCDVYWGEDGLLYKNGYGQIKELKLQMSTAWGMFHDNNREIPITRYDVGRIESAIQNLPDHIEASWLEIIAEFTNRMARYTDVDWRVFATTRALLNYADSVRAERIETLVKEYLDFSRQLPGFKARIEAVRFFKRHGKVDPLTFMGIDI